VKGLIFVNSPSFVERGKNKTSKNPFKNTRP